VFSAVGDGMGDDMDDDDSDPVPEDALLALLEAAESKLVCLKTS
jgi:hypothetical protein